MKRSLAVLLRKLANRLDPPKEHIYTPAPVDHTGNATDYRLTFLP